MFISVDEELQSNFFLSDIVNVKFLLLYVDFEHMYVCVDIHAFRFSSF